MRPSSIRPGQPSFQSSANTAALRSQLLEKKKEYDAVRALERVSSEYLARIQALAEDFETMAETGEAFGQVLAQWPEMFKILNMFLDTRDKGNNQEAEAATDLESANLTAAGNGQKIVRVPIEELEQQQQQQNK